MSYKDPSTSSKPYRDPTPLPESVPKIQELGTTSGPLKSAAFFIGAYCKDYNGEFWFAPVVMVYRAVRDGTRRSCGEERTTHCQIVYGLCTLNIDDFYALYYYVDDFMLCKSEERDPGHCLKEGRRVTRCAQDLITKMRENCLQDFDKHWNCLEKNNHEYNRCRKVERPLNKCMFEKLGLVKTIPGTPEGHKPIHEVESPIFTGVQK
ncbi:hypothetical protein EUX98_g3849 [Antrodiella citrinella]|uniref:NADH-ubiquinone oxidoreductase n=1 Tax=Antrodiella citrinella TaxID=2447956 RepID=A0A4V3XIS3_9APHY|nr:hypothetical protein EUX98_g3849 [Antrodiella citrinella]